MFENKLVWMNGPFNASRNDITIYCQAGLHNIIPEGHRVIADRGYMGTYSNQQPPIPMIQMRNETLKAVPVLAMSLSTAARTI